MGSPFRSEFDARVLIAERERELRDVDEREWRAQTGPKTEDSRAVRRIVGAWVTRGRERLTRRSGAPTRDPSQAEGNGWQRPGRTRGRFTSRPVAAPDADGGEWAPR